MARLIVVGVRHHSPACARVVAETIRTQRPRFVLIEGPCDMNERLDELALAHQLPIAIYTYRLDAGQRVRARGTWSPFCDYSPEWVALREGRALGAAVRFIDLPAWHDAFAATENRYSDRHLLVSDRLAELAHGLGFDSVDTLWDHLFEHGGETGAIAADLDRYFAELRSDEPAGERDGPREAYMAQWMGWALAQASAHDTVLTVCGGYHKPALERLATMAATALPEVPTPPEPVRVGSYLVPFSNRRLDSFSGYASGMPSPAFYQAVWQHGAQAGRQMLARAAQRLRSKRQRVSTADLIAAHELALGLARLRGHAEPLRADVLDALTGALIKDALPVPAPWSMRGPLPRGTDPMLVEMVAELCGDTVGALGPGTPRPPLVADAFACLEAAGLRLGDELQEIAFDALDAAERPRREVLHRLFILQVEGVALRQPADLRRGRRAAERWALQRTLLTEPTLIERAVYGATLREAAQARLEEELAQAPGTAALVAALEQALLAGLGDLVGQLVPLARAAIEREAELAKVGAALTRLRGLGRMLAGLDELGPLLAAAVERAVWLFEGCDGPHRPFDRAEVDAVAALRDVVTDEPPLPDATRTAVLEVLRRRAQADDAPPALRGAAIGALWSAHDAPAAGLDVAATGIRAVADDALGDFLSGLFCVAREEFLASALLDLVDTRLRGLAQPDFLVALPALRRSFSFFPPRQRLAIADRLVRGAPCAGDARALLAPLPEAALIQRAAALESALFALIERFGLEDA